MGLYEITKNAIVLSKRNRFVRTYDSITKNFTFGGIERKICKMKAKKIINKMDISCSSLWDFIMTMDLFEYDVHEMGCSYLSVDAKYYITIRRFSMEDKTFHIEFECDKHKLEIQSSANKLVSDFNTPNFTYHTILEECKDERLYEQIEDFVKFMIYKVYCYRVTHAKYSYNVL